MPDDLTPTNPNALVHVPDPVLRDSDAAGMRETGGRGIARLGIRALSALGKNPTIRKAALASAAFGVGYQLSRMARSGSLPQVAEGVRDLYRVANGEELPTEGPLASSWVRESVTIITAVYGFLDREDDTSD
jgi:hypothetical protein